jgi:hypothetical protein
MRKIVRENINERWTSSVTDDTPVSYYEPEDTKEIEHENQDDFSNLIPPPEIKLTIEDFNDYVDNIITLILPQSSTAALNIFKSLLNTHPYLTKKTVGFKGENPYEKTINKFIKYFNKVTNE